MRNKILISVSLVCFVASTTIAHAARCADYSNCRQAVIAWCNGEHPRADGDGDGIPCENVCRSLEQVEKIKKEIGCNR